MSWAAVLRRWGGDEVAQEMPDGAVETEAASDSHGTSRPRRIGQRPTAACWVLRRLLAAGCCASERASGCGDARGPAGNAGTGALG